MFGLLERVGTSGGAVSSGTEGVASFSAAGSGGTLPVAGGGSWTAELAPAGLVGLFPRRQEDRRRSRNGIAKKRCPTCEGEETSESGREAEARKCRIFCTLQVLQPSPRIGRARLRSETWRCACGMAQHAACWKRPAIIPLSSLKGGWNKAHPAVYEKCPRSPFFC